MTIESTRENGPGQDNSTASETTHSVGEYPQGSLPAHADVILAWIDEHVDGETYCKSKDIADDVEIDTQRIGTAMGQLASRSDLPVDIERWGETNGFVRWRIDPDPETQLVSCRLPSEQLEDLDRVVSRNDFDTRSAAIRAAIDGMLDDDRQAVADGGAPPYTFPPDQKGHDSPISVANIEAVYRQVWRDTGGDGWTDPNRLEVGELSNSELGAALAELAGDDGCPLEFERWSSKDSTPIKYRVRQRELVADGGTVDGAVDHDYDDAELSAQEKLLDEYAETRTQPIAMSVAIDLVTRQPLYIREKVADDLVEYYEREDFDLLNYKMHPYLPVTIDDPVYECVFLATNPESGHKPGQTYDYPRGRLMTLPIEKAWGGESDGQ